MVLHRVRRRQKPGVAFVKRKTVSAKAVSSLAFEPPTLTVNTSR